MTLCYHRTRAAGILPGAAAWLTSVSDNKSADPYCNIDLHVFSNTWCMCVLVVKKKKKKYDEELRNTPHVRRQLKAFDLKYERRPVYFINI